MESFFFHVVLATIRNSCPRELPSQLICLILKGNILGFLPPNVSLLFVSITTVRICFLIIIIFFNSDNNHVKCCECIAGNSLPLFGAVGQFIIYLTFIFVVQVSGSLTVFRLFPLSLSLFRSLCLEMTCLSLLHTSHLCVSLSLWKWTLLTLSWTEKSRLPHGGVPSCFSALVSEYTTPPRILYTCTINRHFGL